MESSWRRMLCSIAWAFLSNRASSPESFLLLMLYEQEKGPGDSSGAFGLEVAITSRFASF